MTNPLELEIYEATEVHHRLQRALNVKIKHYDKTRDELQIKEKAMIAWEQKLTDRNNISR